jgi:Raf kinase inhibitor-like YbhB/YbcL family protein
MKLWSRSWADGEWIPARYAAGRPDGDSVGISDNFNPHLAWSDAPAGTRSFALVCHDPDVPSRPDDVNKPDREVPASLPRVDFFHWLLVDLPPSITEIAEGEYSSGFVAHGKPGPATLHGAKQGKNDYTGWFAGDPNMSGDYFGYDGPFPPFNDSIVHHYVFTLYALDVPRLELDDSFDGRQVRDALAGHVLAEARHVGTYTLNRKLIG